MISWAATLSSTRPGHPVRVEVAVEQAGGGVAASAEVEAVDAQAAVVAVGAEAGTAVTAVEAEVEAAIAAGNHPQQ